MRCIDMRGGAFANLRFAPSEEGSCHNFTLLNLQVEKIHTVSCCTFLQCCFCTWHLQHRQVHHRLLQKSKR